MKIGITGGICSGKSYVSRMLGLKGIHVYNCDIAAHRLMHCDPEVRAKLREAFGPEIFDPEDGHVNKDLLKEKILGGQAEALNEIVHKAVIQDFLDSGYDWLESAILFESGADKVVDKVILVEAPIEVRLQRLVERRGMSMKEARAWIKKQGEYDRSKADFIIESDGKKCIECQINKALETLISEEFSQ